MSYNVTMEVCCFRALLITAILLVPSVRMAAGATGELSGRVLDENGLAVAGAQVTLTGLDPAAVLSTNSDQAGRFRFPLVEAGRYRLRVEKVGYYALVSSSLELSEHPRPLELVINHQQEFEETVSVDYSAPVIDQKEAAVQTTITAEQIVEIPFPATHDFRNALPLLSGVVKDNRGRMHMNGGAENQALYTLDGFNITSPVSGILENRISVDSLRSVRLESSRYSVENGKGSAGVVALESLRGDDHFRFSATNFVPSFESHGSGLTLSNWNPRATFSGPLVKGRAWYFNSMDLQYDLNVIDMLPVRSNTNRNWFGSNMSLVQINLTSKNILSLGFLFNFRDSNHLGLSPLDPVETSRNRGERFYFLNVKDQAYFSGGWVLETGAAVNHQKTTEWPLGGATYIIRPQGRSGNYFMRSAGNVQRLQGIVNLLSPYYNWHGRHNFKFGIDANRIHYEQLAQRRTIEMLRFDGSLSRMVSYSGTPQFSRSSSEFSAYFQDRWSPRETVLVEAGIRLDWDQILRYTLWSPRIALTYSPQWLRDAKFSAGIGIFHDPVNLAVLTRELDQRRVDSFYDDDGTTILLGPLQTRYLAGEQDLKSPVYLNWSLGLEKKLPGSFYFRTNFIHKTGRHGWAYDFYPDVHGDGWDGGTFLLRSQRRDRYYGLDFTFTRTFRQKYAWLLSYTRSRSRSTAIIDFSLENPVFGRQAGGPLDWDAPNRLISYSLLPLPYFSKYSIAYFLEWHSGFPYSVVDDSQQIVGSPNNSRFPDYLSLNLHCERRFNIKRTQWALRAGFNNIIGNRNAVAVINTISSPDFRHFSGGQGRVFTGRIRFLGKS